MVQAAALEAVLGSVVSEMEKIHTSKIYFGSRPTVYANGWDVSGQLYRQSF